MASTGEEGAKKLQSNCTFYQELDDILGTRHAINPTNHMTISSSKVIPEKKSPQKDQSWKRDKTYHLWVLILSSLALVQPQMDHHQSRSKSPKDKRERPQAQKKGAKWPRWRPLHEGNMWHVAYFHGKASRTLQPQHGTSAGCYTKPDRADQGSCVRPKRHFERLFKKWLKRCCLCCRLIWTFTCYCRNRRPICKGLQTSFQTCKRLVYSHKRVWLKIEQNK